MKRKLLNGNEAPEFDFAIELIVLTKCPSKYKLVDMETGEEYIGNLPTDNKNYYWRRVNNGS